MPTIFDKIINKEISSEIIHETDDVLAFKDINPVAPVHILIIPKKHISTINDIEKDDAYILAKLLLAVKEIANKMNIDKSGYRVVVNCNDDGGQTVDHLHIHLLGGRKLDWPPG